MNEAPRLENLLDLTGRTALVTGAGSGIGAAIARRLAEAGANVGVHYHTSAEGAERTAREIEGLGRRAVTIAADVGEARQADSILARCEEALDTVTVLINNAGLYPVSPIVDMEPEEWERVLRVNLDGVHHCTRAAARRMIAAGRHGAIVNLSSIEAEVPMPGHAHYNAAKAGVSMYTRTAASELGAHGIRVNAVAPGLIDRAGLEDAWPEGVTAWRRGCPLGRLGQGEDVADACLFLATAASRWVTGTTLRVDGGFLSRGMIDT